MSQFVSKLAYSMLSDQCVNDFEENVESTKSLTYASGEGKIWAQEEWLG